VSADHNALWGLSPEEVAEWNRRIESSGLFRWARDAMAEATAYHAAIDPLGYTEALRYIEANPPSPRCVLALARAGHVALLRRQTQAGANAANARNIKARQHVQAEWAKCADDPHRIKARFARKMKPEIKARFGVDPEIKTITDTWLKGL
jgi:hypothetical protein